MTVQIHVNSNHIATGTPRRPDACALALAVKDAIPDTSPEHVSVGARTIFIGQYPYQLSATMSADMIEFRRTADSGERVEPATFTLEFFSSIISESANFTIGTTNRGVMFNVTTGSSNVTATLPSASTVGAGWTVLIRKADSGTGLVLTSPTTSPSACSVSNAGHWTILTSDGTNWLHRDF